MANVMSRPEGYAMHGTAKRLAPQAFVDYDDLMLKPKSVLIAVEKHNVNWKDESVQAHERFLWIKGRAKITVQKIYDSYIINCGEPASGLELKLGNQVVDKSVSLGDLDTYLDRHIVFTTQDDAASSSAPAAAPAPAPSPVRPLPVAQAQADAFPPMHHNLDATQPNGTSSAQTNGSESTQNGDISSATGKTHPRSHQSYTVHKANGPANVNGHLQMSEHNATHNMDSPVDDADIYTHAGAQSGLASRTPSMQDLQSTFSHYLAPAGRTPSHGAVSRQTTASQQPRTPTPHGTPAPRIAASQTGGPRDGSRPSTNPSRASPSLARQEPAPSAARKNGFNTMASKPDYLSSRASSTSDASAFKPGPAPAVKSEPLPLSQEYNPRQVDNSFEEQPEENLPERGAALQQLCAETVPERLEAAVRKGVKILSSIEQPLETMQHLEDAQNWLAQIETVRAQAVRTRTVVGVVGNTGAGKSSVINAMLDEERLVPTNCMRACTAVVTELSYNDSKNPNSRYRAEIEFIKPEDWLRELNVIHTEVFDKHTGAFNKEATNPDTDAGVAWAKIKAVYFKMSKDQLAMTSPDALMQDHNVKSILGTTRRINSADCPTFYKRLQNYVDSKDKVELDKNGNKKTNPKRHFEFWPLIKVVKVYTKADALSTGAVLVDLPGVHDSNAARAAVAEGYMKQCTGLWIVAPINRAIDDKAAKNLLGESFRRQLKFDGIYAAVTFICSKTDDISRTEATDSLRLGSRMTDLEDRMSEIIAQKRILKKKSTKARDDKDDHDDAVQQIEDELDTWEDLESQLESGETVYPPGSKSRKRKRGSDSPQPRKNRDRDDLEDEGESAQTEQGEALTSNDVEVKLRELKQLRKEARGEAATLKRELSDLKEEIASLEKEEAEVSDEQDIMCIRGRNEYSRGAIQQDFAAGMKELNQENAELADEQFNPDADDTDYEDVARKLPVFCVSSRAYQKLSGRLQKDNAVAGFTSPDQTEIPQLQVHCKKLTENGRQSACRGFLNDLRSLLNSISLWASDDGTGVQMTMKQRDVEKRFLVNQLKKLEKALEAAVANTVGDVVATLDDYVFAEFNGAVKAAASKAVPTAQGWGAHRQAGGLFWATYKAIVRRYGCYNSASGGNRDFNQDLVEPLYKHLATSWEKAFQRRLPHILQGFTKVASNTMKHFHQAVESRIRESGLGLARVGRLQNSLSAYEAIFKDLASLMIGGLNEAQREVNREFTPVIASAMTSAYESCTAESGSGSFKRMKDHMNKHVADNQVSMFDDACSKVKASLTKTCEDVRQNMLDRADQVYVNMRRDYMTLIGVDMSKGHEMPREERAMRRDVDVVLDGSDAAFQEVVDVDDSELGLGEEVDEMDVKRDDDWDDGAQDDDEEGLFVERAEDEEGSESGGARDEDGDVGDEDEEEGLGGTAPDDADYDEGNSGD